MQKGQHLEYIPVIISLIALVASIYFNGGSKKRTETADAVQKAAETATINVKLDQIGQDVRDIKYDITSVKRDVQDLDKRMVAVEQSTKSAHKRIDDHEEKEKG